MELGQVQQIHGAGRDVKPIFFIGILEFSLIYCFQIHAPRRLRRGACKERNTGLNQAIGREIIRQWYQASPSILVHVCLFQVRPYSSFVPSHPHGCRYTSTAYVPSPGYSSGSRSRMLFSHFDWVALIVLLQLNGNVCAIPVLFVTEGWLWLWSSAQRRCPWPHDCRPKDNPTVFCW